jgi:hypothetical protein
VRRGARCPRRRLTGTMQHMLQAMRDAPALAAALAATPIAERCAAIPPQWPRPGKRHTR